MQLIIFTAAECDAAKALDADGECEIDPRAVDAADPGTAVDLNTGAEIALVGHNVAPRAIVDAPAYQRRCPQLIAYLLTLPYAELDPAQVFAPVADDD